MNLRFSILALAAVEGAMANKDVRYYLNGVCVETIPGGGLALVGTDGHSMTVARDPAGAWDGRDDDALAQLILPRDFVLSILKSTKGVDDVSVQLTETQGCDSRVFDLTYETGSAVFRARSIDGRYPDWRACIPRSEREPGEMGAFDPAVLEPALAAALAINKRRRTRTKATVQFFGAGEACTGFLLTNCEGISVGGVVMPVRESMAERTALDALAA